jgi:cell division initiation protein
MENGAKLKLSTFGYNKRSVEQYINQLNEEFEEKLKEKEEQILQLNAQIKKYLAQLDAVNQDTSTSSESKSKIADVLIKAQSTADAILEEAKANAIKEKKEIEKLIEEDREKLVDLKTEIKKIRSSVTLALKTFEKQIDNIE